jgi:hypothetical protein
MAALNHNPEAGDSTANVFSYSLPKW